MGALKDELEMSTLGIAMRESVFMLEVLAALAGMLMVGAWMRGADAGANFIATPESFESLRKDRSDIVINPSWE